MINVGDLFVHLSSSDSFSLFIFPFLLLFAVIFTALQRVSLLKSNKASVFVISFILSFAGVYFKTPSGNRLGHLMMKLFPNISVLSIGILALYVVGAVLGQDFFKGVFQKDTSSYIYQAVGVLGLGSIIYFVGDHFGFFKFGTESYWNMIILVAIVIVGVLLLFTSSTPLGLVLLFVALVFIFGEQRGNILELFYDPFILIISIVILLMGWMNSSDDEKEKLAKSLRKSDENISKYEEQYGRRPRDFESRIFDIVDERHKRKNKKWNEKYPGENYK